MKSLFSKRSSRRVQGTHERTAHGHVRHLTENEVCPVRDEGELCPISGLRLRPAGIVYRVTRALADRRVKSPTEHPPHGTGGAGLRSDAGGDLPAGLTVEMRGLLEKIEEGA